MIKNNKAVIAGVLLWWAIMTTSCQHEKENKNPIIKCEDSLVFESHTTCNKNQPDFVPELIYFCVFVRNNKDQTVRFSFKKVIKPVNNPKLTEECIQSTGISQNSVDAADSLLVVYEQYLTWLHDHGLDKNDPPMDCYIPEELYNFIWKNGACNKALLESGGSETEPANDLARIDDPMEVDDEVAEQQPTTSKTNANDIDMTGSNANEEVIGQSEDLELVGARENTEIEEKGKEAGDTIHVNMAKRKAGATLRIDGAKKPKKSDLPAENLNDASPDVQDQSTSRPVCCSLPPEMRYNVSNRICSGYRLTCQESGATPCEGDHKNCCYASCRIPPDADYMGLKTGRKAMDYCMTCFEKVEDKQKIRFVKLKNQNDIFEDLLKCGKCSTHWHRCCAFHFEEKDEFKCNTCLKKAGIKPTMRTLKSIALSTDALMMEKKLNEVLEAQLGSEESSSGKISVRSLISYPKRKMTKAMVPSFYKTQFEKKYGPSITYKTRTIMVFQRQNDVDVLFCVLFVQEYENLVKSPSESWFVINYLDTAQLIRPVEVKKSIYTAVILSYINFARSIGLLHGYLWSNPPEQGDDYVFNCHPKTQGYLNQTLLNKWYRTVLSQGKAQSIVDHYHDFKESEIQNTEDLPIFVDSLWSKVMLELENSCKKFKDPKEMFEKNMKTEDFPQHQHDNFFIYLNKLDSVPKMTTATRTKIAWLLESEEFLRHCIRRNWEFADSRRAAFASASIVQVLNEIF
ncbi:unnamed protein product [Caenorhabditis nigoni]